MKKTYVLYHANCPDGFGAAYAFYKKYKETAIYIPVVHGKPTPEIEANSDVFIVDFSYSKETLLELQQNHSSLTVLDHHKTAKADLEGLDFAHFDMDKSGAVISFEYLYKEQAVPTLFKYLEDRDLWLFKQPNSKEAHAFISSFAYKFSDYEYLEKTFTNNFQKVVSSGKTLLKRDELEVAEICKQTRVVNFSGYQIPCVNTSVLNSDVGNKLLEFYPQAKFSMSFYINDQGNIKASLRSRGNFDVSKIAKLFGGGGHPAASGCIIDKIPE